MIKRIKRWFFLRRARKLNAKYEASRQAWAAAHPSPTKAQMQATEEAIARGELPPSPVTVPVEKRPPIENVRGVYPHWGGSTQKCDNPECTWLVAVNAPSPSECFCSHECAMKVLEGDEGEVLRED